MARLGYSATRIRCDSDTVRLGYGATRIRRDSDTGPIHVAVLRSPLLGCGRIRVAAAEARSTSYYTGPRPPPISPSLLSAGRRAGPRSDTPCPRQQDVPRPRWQGGYAAPALPSSRLSRLSPACPARAGLPRALRAVAPSRGPRGGSSPRGRRPRRLSLGGPRTRRRPRAPAASSSPPSSCSSLSPPPTRPQLPPDAGSRCALSPAARVPPLSPRPGCLPPPSRLCLPAQAGPARPPRRRGRATPACRAAGF